ncbi:hypothetical protein C0991_006601, partial [Blastosporella zonata]
AEFSLLGSGESSAASDHGILAMEMHDLSTAPLITREAFDLGGYSKLTTQYGVLGRVVSTQ